MQNANGHEELRVQAGRIAGNANLRDLRLTQSELNLHYVPEPGAPLRVKLSISPEATTTKIAEDISFIVVSAGFEVTIDTDTESISEADLADDSPVAQIQFKLAAAFSHTLTNELDETELEAFATTTGLFALYPYAREYVSDATRRLGLPTLVLDLFKPPV